MFSISALCNHFRVQAEIESYIGNKIGCCSLQCKMAAMDVYYRTIYGAIGLQLKMAALYGQYLTKNSNRRLLSQGNSYKPADVPSGCKCITLFVTQHLLIMIAMRA